MSKLDQMLKNDLSVVKYTLTETTNLELDSARRRSGSGSSALDDSDSKTKLKRCHTDLFALVTENLKLSPLPTLRLKSPQGISLTRARSLPVDNIYDSEYSDKYSTSEPSYSVEKTSPIVSVRAEYNGLPFLGEHISVFETTHQKNDRFVLHKYHADPMKKVFELGMTRAISLEGLTPSINKISLTSVMIKIPPVTTHLELGDFENIPMHAWFMPYIVSSVPPQFMKILSELPNILDTKTSRLSSVENLSGSVSTPRFATSVSVSDKTSRIPNSLKTPGHKRHHTSTTFAEVTKAALAMPGDMYEQFATLDSPVQHSAGAYERGGSTLPRDFSGFDESSSSSSSAHKQSLFPSSWKSLGLLWVSKDPTWRPWEVKQVYLLDNYLYEVTADGKLILGFAPLCEATIVRQSYRISKRSAGIQRSNDDQHFPHHGHKLSTPRHSPKPSVEVTPAMLASISDPRELETTVNAALEEMEVPTMSTVLKITCFTTTQRDSPTATFYLTSRVRHTVDSTEYELSRIEAALRQASALTIHDLYDFEVKEKKRETSSTNLQTMRAFQSPGVGPGLLGNLNEPGQKHVEDHRVLGRGRFTEVRLARRKPVNEIESTLPTPSDTPHKAPLTTRSTISPIAEKEVKKSSPEQKQQKNERIRTGSNGSLSSIPEKRRVSNVSPSHGFDARNHSSNSVLDTSANEDENRYDNCSDYNSENESNYGEDHFEDRNSVCSDGVQRHHSNSEDYENIRNVFSADIERETMQGRDISATSSSESFSDLTSNEATSSKDRESDRQQHLSSCNSGSQLEHGVHSVYVNAAQQSLSVDSVPVTPPSSSRSRTNSNNISTESQKQETLQVDTGHDKDRAVVPTCAVKLISKELFWARVTTAQERTDALVREVLAQSLLSRFYKIISQSHHMQTQALLVKTPSTKTPSKTPTTQAPSTCTKVLNGKKSSRDELVSKYHATMNLLASKNAIAGKSKSDLKDIDDSALNNSNSKLTRHNTMIHTSVSTPASLGNPAASSSLQASNNPLPIVEIYHIFETMDGFAIELELMNSLDLFDKLGNDGPMSELQVSYIIAQLVDAIAMCNKMGLAHRDVKLSNITFPRYDSEFCVLVKDPNKLNSTAHSPLGKKDVMSPFTPFRFSGSDDHESATSCMYKESPQITVFNSDFNDSVKLLRIKLADFGMAGFLGSDRKLRGRCGTPGYVAPDILCAEKQGAYDINVDMFSVGVAAYTLLVGYEPFYGNDNKELMEANKAVNYAFHSPEWDLIDADTKDFIERCFAYTAETRITPEQAKKHPFIRKSFEIVESYELKQKETREQSQTVGSNSTQNVALENSSADNCVVC